MTSESQERMLAIVTPADRSAVEEVCRRWEVRATVIGTVTGGGRLRILDADGGVLADVPAASMSDDAPLYDRPRSAPADLDRRRRDDPWPALKRSVTAQSCAADVLALLADASWVYRQYDHQLFLNTVVGPGEDAAVLRLAAPGLTPSERGLAISTDSSPRWCAVDPRQGTAMTVAESALNVACAGARPLALVNCLNFGNPEHPEVMWQLSESVDGMAEACLALKIPVIGGNVSLYNASAGTDIDPTPVVAVLGVIDRLERRPPGMAFASGSTLVLLGDTDPALAGSRWAVECHGHRGGTLPALDLAAHARLLEFLTGVVPVDGLLTSVHDVSGGGVALALAEGALASGVGCAVDGVADHAELFSESASRVVLGTRRPDEVLDRAAAAGVPARLIGTVGGDRLVVAGLLDIAVADAAEAWRVALPGALGEPVGL
jgi:phosphoribosylformylglycinamidine synthase